MLADLLWTEKYRPAKLDDLALEGDTRKLLDSYLEAGEIPHLLLVGPPGSGKTTVARILTDSLDCQVLTLNASTERGIDVVREKIGNFVMVAFGARWNIVFLDEADAMTSDAQTAMRNLIETFAERSRFILTANAGYKIIGPIQSRCQVLTLGAPPVQERFRILHHVLTEEGIGTTPEVTLSYATQYPDMRRMLMAVQRAALTAPASTSGLLAGTVMLPPAGGAGGVNGIQILAAVESKNWRALRAMAASGDFDPAQGLRDLFWAIPDDHKRCGFLRHVVGRGVHESGFSPDPVILFLGTCAEAGEGL